MAVRISIYTEPFKSATAIINLSSVRIRFFTYAGSPIPPGEFVEEWEGLIQTERFMTEGDLSIEILDDAFEMDYIVYLGYVQVFSDEMSQQMNMPGEIRIKVETGIMPPQLPEE